MNMILNLSEEERIMLKERAILFFLCVSALAILALPDFVSINLSLIIFYLEIFFEGESLPQLMQGASMAVLTLLVSFAIGIVVHYLSDRKGGNALHLHVALDYVWYFKRTLFILVMNVVSPFFLVSQDLFFNLLVLFIWVCSFIWLCVIVLRIYEWVKGDKEDFIKGYLVRFNKTAKDKIIAWGEFWSMDLNIKKRFLEAEFFVSFSQQIDSLMHSDKKEDWYVAFQMLEDFKNSIRKRNQVFITVFPEFFPKILEWHFMIWQMQYSQFRKGATQKFNGIDEYLFKVELLIVELIKFVTVLSLIETNRAHSYFSFLDKHIEKYQNQSIAGDQHNYDYINMIPIYTDCLNMIPKSRQSYYIWNHHFPKSWKITIENYENNKITRLWYEIFLEWSRDRIWNEDDKLDPDLDKNSRELFPNVDPNIWAHIYTFALRPHPIFSLKGVIDAKVKFGYVGRAYSGSSENFEENFAVLNKEYFNNTIELAAFLFPRVFTLKNVDGWLVELERLEYPKDSPEYLRQQFWIRIMIALKKRLT